MATSEEYAVTLHLELSDISSVLPGSIATNLPSYQSSEIACYFEFSTSGQIKCLNIGSLVAGTYYWIVCRGYLPYSEAATISIGAITLFTVDDSNV